MKKYPAIALIEFSSIAIGIKSSDSMVKRAPITMLKAGTVSKGRFLILIGGSVASVEEAYTEGLSIGEGSIVDSVILPNVHIQVHNAILGDRLLCRGDGIAVFETRSVASVIRCADAAIKGANVDIIEMRLADALGGKAFVLFTGKVEDLESAISIAKESVVHHNIWVDDTIIPRVDRGIAQQIDETTRFAKSKSLLIEDGEIENVIGKSDRDSDSM